MFDAGTGATLLQIQMGNSTESSVATIEGERRLFVCSLDGTPYSFAANTGRLLWKLQTGGPVHSSPAIEGGRVYVGSEVGRLYAVAGGVAWSKSVGGAVYESPAVGFGAVSPRFATWRSATGSSISKAKSGSMLARRPTAPPGLSE